MPGMMNFPAPLISSLPCGITIPVRAPAIAMRGPDTSTTEFETGGPPAPSISTAPTIARTFATSGGLHPIRQKVGRMREKERKGQIGDLPPIERVTTTSLRLAVYALLGRQLHLVVIGAG